jgi:sugar lactone lactonase YvrE
MKPKTRIIVDGLSFPESPRWRQGALWFSDIHDHKVYRLEPGGKPEVIVKLYDRVSGLGFLPDGDLLIVSMLDRRLISVDSDRKQRWYADVAHLSKIFINDMVVDAQGRAYVGSRNGGNPASKSDSLILVQPDGDALTLLDDMVSPNGAVITPDGKELIIAETAVGRLNRFAITPNGGIADRRTFAELAGHHIDGICRDAQGGFWAGGGAGGLLRIGPTGSLERVYEFPDRMVLACTLGGPEMKTLFLATTDTSLVRNLSKIGYDRNRDKDVNSAGRIEAMTVEIPGVDEG